jgi:WD domain, G-beta repeat
MLSQATGSFDETVRFWDVRTGRCLRELPAHSDPVTGIDFSWDGTVLASCSFDGLLRLWDAHTGHCLRTVAIDGASSPLSALRFSPNGVCARAAWINERLCSSACSCRVRPKPSVIFQAWRACAHACFLTFHHTQYASAAACAMLCTHRAIPAAGFAKRYSKTGQLRDWARSQDVQRAREQSVLRQLLLCHNSWSFTVCGGRV